MVPEEPQQNNGVPLSDHMAAEELTSENQSTIDTDDLRDVQLVQSTQPLGSAHAPPGTIEPESHLTPELGPEPNDMEPSNEMVELCGLSKDPHVSDINEPGEDRMVEEMTSGFEDEDKGFTCTLCGKLFRAKWTLKYHQRVHTGEKPYTCLTCDRQFRQPSHLKIHQRTHSGERPYVCDACGRAFIDSSTMRRHARVHKEGVADHPGTLDESGSTEENAQEERHSDVNTTSNQSTTLNDNTAQPINANIVQVVGELGRSNTNQGEDIVLSANKIPNVAEVNWQSAGQMTYYIVPTNKESPEKQETFENMSF